MRVSMGGDDVSTFRFSWGYVAAIVTDKTKMRELVEEDPNFVNPLYIHLSQKLLHSLLYVTILACASEC